MTVYYYQIIYLVVTILTAGLVLCSKPGRSLDQYGLPLLDGSGDNRHQLPSDESLENRHIVQQDDVLPERTFQRLLDNVNKQARQSKRKRKAKKHISYADDDVWDQQHQSDVTMARGPPGPPGPPGARVNVDTLMKLFRKQVEEEAHTRAEQLLAKRCPNCRNVRNETLGLLEAGHVDMLPHVTSAFFQTLTDSTRIKARDSAILANYNQPFPAGSFDRGHSFNSQSGRFYAPLDGVYYFSVTLNVEGKGYRALRSRPWRRADRVQVWVCIQSDCAQRSSLSTISGMESNSDVFTVHLSGLLFLQNNDYIHVYVENKSRRSIRILEASSFQGVLLGT